MPSEHGVRQRAVICQDCWFFKEMNCALASPENGVCANRRPVNGRVVAPRVAKVTPATLAPFSADAPEATFSLAQVVPTGPVAPAPAAVQQQLHVADVAARPVHGAPPSYREIRSGRAAAASRAPVAEVRIPISEVDGDVAPMQRALPGMDQLVERVRQRTAARISRAGAPHLA